MGHACQRSTRRMLCLHPACTCAQELRPVNVRPPGPWHDGRAAAAAAAAAGFSAGTPSRLRTPANTPALKAPAVRAAPAGRAC